jgi:histone-lysine N-methyltransferase SETD3
MPQVPAGTPLLLNYGKLGNDFLLLDYGFIVPDNPYDRVALRFDTNLIDVSGLG